MQDLSIVVLVNLWTTQLLAQNLVNFRLFTNQPLDSSNSVVLYGSKKTTQVKRDSSAIHPCSVHVSYLLPVQWLANLAARPAFSDRSSRASCQNVTYRRCIYSIDTRKFTHGVERAKKKFRHRRHGNGKRKIFIFILFLTFLGGAARLRLRSPRWPRCPRLSRKGKSITVVESRLLLRSFAYIKLTPQHSRKLDALARKCKKTSNCSDGGWGLTLTIPKRKNFCILQRTFSSVHSVAFPLNVRSRQISKKTSKENHDCIPHSGWDVIRQIQDMEDLIED